MDALYYLVSTYVFIGSIIGLLVLRSKVLVPQLSKAKTDLEEIEKRVEKTVRIAQVRINNMSGKRQQKAPPPDEEEEEADDEEIDGVNAALGQITPQSIASMLTMDSGAILDQFAKEYPILRMVPRQAAIGFIDSLKQRATSTPENSGGGVPPGLY